jgi:hypothetical protein
VLDPYRFRASIRRTAEAALFPAPREGGVLDLSRRPARGIVVGILGNDTDDDLALLEDGSRHPGALFVVLDRNRIRLRGRRLSAELGLVERNGELIFLRFQPELVVDYLVNYNHEPVASDRLSIPFTLHDWVRDYVSRKDVTLEILRAAGLSIPGGASFTLGRRRHAAQIELADPETLPAETRPPQGNLLSSFLRDHGCQEGVMKPNDGAGGSGVHFFRREDVAEKGPLFWRLLRRGSEVVLQERITPPLVQQEGRWLDWNLRVFVSRDGGGRPVAREIAVRIGDQGGPINGSRGAEWRLLEEMATPLGWSPSTVVEVRELALRESERAYLAIGRALSQVDGTGDDRSWPDILGADIIVRQQGGRWQAFIIEMNVNPGGAWDLNHRLRLIARSLPARAEAMGLLSREILTQRLGGANRDWIRWMLNRTQQPAIIGEP